MDSAQNNSSSSPKVKLNLGQTLAAKSKIQELAVKQLWRTGDFQKLILDTNQLSVLEEVARHRASGSVKSFILASRRIGKSVLLCAAAVKECLDKPGTRVLYLSKTTDNLREILDMSMSVVLETAPEDIRPTYKERYLKYVFNNGSEIRFKGLDKAGGDAVRGVKAKLIIFDEACFMSNLHNLVRNIAMPMVVAESGYMLFGSSAPDTPGHESVGVIQECEEAGVLIKRDIYSCPRWTKRQIELFEQEAGGKDSTTFRREYLVHLISEADRAVLPAATEDKMKTLIVEPAPLNYKPDRYVALDIGFRDLTVALFAYWDYPNGKVVIEDELVLKENSATTDNIARGIAEKELQLWDGVRPYKRVCDTDPRLIADLRRLSGIDFVATKKDNLNAQVNHANLMILNNQVQIHPRCRVLIAHMKYALWNKQFTEFQRTSSLGHCDAVAAFVYLIRNITKSRNPIKEQVYSPHYFANAWEQSDLSISQQANKIKKLFG